MRWEPIYESKKRCLLGSFVHLKYSAGSVRGCIGATVSEDFWKIPWGKDVLIRPGAPFLVSTWQEGPGVSGYRVTS